MSPRSPKGRPRARRFRVHELPEKRFEAVRLRVLGAEVTGLEGKASVVHVRLPARGRHPSVVHPRTHEMVFIVSGRALGTLGRTRMVLRKGDAVSIPAGMRHAFVAGPRGVEALSLFSPPLRVDPPARTRKRTDG